MTDSDHTAEWVAAGATWAAVVVALFAPFARNWWKRPRLSLQRDLSSMMGDELIYTGEDGEEERVLVVTLVATNHGRSQADDVEAVLTAEQSFGPIPAEEEGEVEIPVFELPTVTRGTLPFEFGHEGDPRLDLPPGASRNIQLAMLGSESRIHKELQKRGEQVPAEAGAPGLFCVLPAQYADRFTAIPSDEPIRILIQLQARNARPSAWRARIKVWRWTYKGEDGPQGGISLSWLEALKKADPSTLPSPRRTWARGHTPLALWRNYRARKEIEEIQKDTQSQP